MSQRKYFVLAFLVLLSLGSVLTLFNELEVWPFCRFAMFTDLSHIRPDYKIVWVSHSGEEFEFAPPITKPLGLIASRGLFNFRMQYLIKRKRNRAVRIIQFFLRNSPGLSKKAVVYELERASGTYRPIFSVTSASVEDVAL